MCGSGKCIRVLHVLGRLDRGGAETMVMELYRCMDREQIQFDFMVHTQDECDYSEEVRRMGGRIYFVPAFHFSSAATYRMAWRSFFKEHPEYTILHSHIRSSASLYLGIAKHFGLTTIIHSHNTSSGTGLKALAKSILQYPLRYQADYLFACSECAGRWLFGRKACAGHNFYLVKNAVNLQRFTYQEEVRTRIRQELTLLKSDQDELVIGHVGRLEEQKNHIFLITVFEEIRKTNPSAVLWLAGAGKLEKMLREILKNKNLLPYVHFLGIREDIHELMQGMDLFIFPSLYEGLPVTLIEAQASGLYVLVSECVTEEVCVCDGMIRMSLEESKEAWARKAQSMCEASKNRKERQNRQKRQLWEAGYEITKVSRWLQGFYESIEAKRN